MNRRSKKAATRVLAQYCYLGSGFLNENEFSWAVGKLPPSTQFLAKSLQKLYVLQRVPTVLLEKHEKIAKKVPAVLFVKHTILVDFIRKNHVTLYTNLPYCSVLTQRDCSVLY
jgi:hypothetical protein